MRMERWIDRADIGQDRAFPAIPVTVTGYSLLVVTPDPLRYSTLLGNATCLSVLLGSCNPVHVSEHSFHSFGFGNLTISLAVDTVNLYDALTAAKLTPLSGKTITFSRFRESRQLWRF